MHFAYPPARKMSRSPPYLPRASAASSSISRGFASLASLRRDRRKMAALAAFAFFVLLYWLVRPAGAPSQVALHKPSGEPAVVIVTVLDQVKYGSAYTDTVRQNRRQYAAKHGYETFLPEAGDYGLKRAPPSWAKVVATRHALTEFPGCNHAWFLEQDVLIMNPQLSLEDHVMKPERLEKLMIKNQSIVPPDSIIKTFSDLRGADADFVLTQDNNGLSVSSFVVRNGDWAKFFLDTWFDPIYRSYNFQMAEIHALEHIVQWHPTILSKLALVDQRLLNAYHTDDEGVIYRDGDLVVRFTECVRKPRSCDAASQWFAQQWRSFFEDS